MKKEILNKTFNGNYYQEGEDYEYLEIQEFVEEVHGMFLHCINYSCSWGLDSENEDSGCVVAVSSSDTPLVLGIDNDNVCCPILGECKILHHYHGEFPVFFNN